MPDIRPGYGAPATGTEFPTNFIDSPAASLGHRVMEADKISLTDLINRLARLDECSKGVLAEASKAFWRAWELWRDEVNKRFPVTKNEHGDVTLVQGCPREAITDLFNPLFYIPPFRRFLHNEDIREAPKVGEEQRQMCDRAILAMIHDVALRSKQTPIYYGDSERGFHTKMLGAWGCVPEGLYKLLTQGQRTWWTDKEFKQMLVHLDGCIDNLQADKDAVRFGFHGRPKSNQTCQYMFKNEGATWRIIYGEHQTTVKDCKGVRYIHYLVKNKNTLVECLDIERACAGRTPEGCTKVETEDALEAGLRSSGYDLRQLDNWDVKDIEGAIENLKASTEGVDDRSRKAVYQKQILALQEYLRKNVNIRGQGRAVGPQEKARDRVQKAVNGAKKLIAKCSEQIGKHFQMTVKPNGTAFIYKPDRELTWSFE